jgi:hypothetical protein
MGVSEDRDAAACRLLVDLLQSDPAYRRVWQHHARRNRPGQLNQAAVAEVLAAHVRSRGIDPSAEGRSLKDRVSRVVSGASLTPQTLRYFIDAFRIRPGDEQRLWRLLEGRSVLAPEGLGPLAPSEPTYRTVNLQEHHTIDGRGLPVSHETDHLVEALRDGVDRYNYRMRDIDSVEVEALKGARAGAIYEMEDGLWCVPMHFDRPLRRGETQWFRYRTRFSYAVAPPPNFRRAMVPRVDSLFLRVQFHEKKLPRRVHFGSWEALDGEILRPRLVEIASDHTVHRLLKNVENTIVGFQWEW